MLFVAGALLLTTLAALVAWMVAFRQESHPGRVLALLYHRIAKDAEFESLSAKERAYSVTEGGFRRQMEYLDREDYRVVSLDSLVRFLEGGPALPPRAVLITFDDGSVSVHERARPVLQDLGMPATLFVITDPDCYVFSEGSRPERRVSAEEIRELEAAGIAIGSHSISHRALETLDRSEIERELADSKKTLEEILGHEVRYFGVPMNWYGPKVRQVARETGYRAVCTSYNGAIRPGADPYRIRRFGVRGGDSLEAFARALRPASLVRRRFRGFLRRIPARMLGPRIWLPLRRRLFGSRLARGLSRSSVWLLLLLHAAVASGLLGRIEAALR